jgi:periplasmic protein TonB
MKKIILIFIFFGFQVTYSQIESEVLPETNDKNIYYYTGIEVKPEYPGGMQEFYKFIGSNYNVPNVKGLKGKILVSFIVEKDGSLTDIKVMRDIGYGTKEETIRVLKNSTKWSPAYQNGKPVRVHYSLPISISSVD